jgi:hypothetical protein
MANWEEKEEIGNGEWKKIEGNGRIKIELG